ncbi:hypothetical protein PoB_006557800, partial [Plakobranchus ocellatus]
RTSLKWIVSLRSSRAPRPSRTADGATQVRAYSTHAHAGPNAGPSRTSQDQAERVLKIK